MSNPKIYYTSQGYLRTVSMRHWTLPVVLKQDHDAAVEQLKAENNKLKSLFSVQLDMLEQNKNMTAEIAALKSKLEKAKKGLEFYADGEGDVLDWSGVNNSAYIQVKGKRAKQTLLEIGDTE